MILDDANASEKLDRLFRLILLGLFDTRTRLDAMMAVMTEEQKQLAYELHRGLIREHADQLMKQFFAHQRSFVGDDSEVSEHEKHINDTTSEEMWTALQQAESREESIALLQAEWERLWKLL